MQSLKVINSQISFNWINNQVYPRKRLLIKIIHEMVVLFPNPAGLKISWSHYPEALFFGKDWDIWLSFPENHAPVASAPTSSYCWQSKNQAY